MLHWNIPTEWLFCTGIFLLTGYFYWNIPTVWMFRTGFVRTIDRRGAPTCCVVRRHGRVRRHRKVQCVRRSNICPLRHHEFGARLQLARECQGIGCNVPTWLHCIHIRMPLLTEYFILPYPYRQNTLYWNVLFIIIILEHLYRLYIP